MDKEKLMDLVNTNFNKFQLEIKRFYKEEYVQDIEQQVKKQKEIINKAIKYVNNHINQETFDGYMDSYELKKLLDILKEVSE